MNTERDHKVRTLWLSGILHAFTHLYQMALVPLYLLIKADFHLASEAEATLLVTVMGVTYYLPSYPMGVLTDRFSRKKLLAIGLALNAAGFIGLAYAPNYASALAWVAIAGFGGSFYHPAATAMVADLYPKTTGKALGLVAIGASVGFFIGPVYAGWRAETAHDWRLPVLEMGIAGLIFSGIFYWLAEEKNEKHPATHVPIPTFKIFPTPALWAFFVGAALFFSMRDFAGNSMSSLGSLFLQQAHGFDPKTTGLMIAGIFLASSISNPVFGRLSDGGRIRWTFLCLSVALVLVAIFPLMPKRWMFLELTLYGFFFLASYPIVEAALMESVPDSVRGRAYGMFITAGGLLGNLSHWVMGATVQHLGADATSPRSYYPTYSVLAGLIALSLFGLPCLHAIRKREEPALHSSKSVMPDPHSIIQ